jgi:hypothetical protein
MLSFDNHLGPSSNDGARMSSSMAVLNGDHRDERDPAPPGWGHLRERVRRYLEREGVPPAQAERFSHVIVVLCADDAEVPGRDGMDERVRREAETMLEDWHAARRATLLETT